MKRVLAVKKSIEHWDRIAAGCDEGLGENECALCALDKERHEAQRACVACPIYRVTGAAHCRATPYDAIWHEWFAADPDGGSWQKDCADEIEKMLKILESALKWAKGANK